MVVWKTSTYVISFLEINSTEREFFKFVVVALSIEPSRYETYSMRNRTVRLRAKISNSANYELN